MEKIVSSLKNIESFFNNDGANGNLTFLTDDEIKSFQNNYKKSPAKPWDNLSKKNDPQKIIAYLRRMPLVPYICFNKQTITQPESNDIKQIANNFANSANNSANHFAHRFVKFAIICCKSLCKVCK